MSRTLKDEDLTKTVAIYINVYGGFNIFEVSDYFDNGENGYIRSSEPYEVTFTQLPDKVILKGRVDFLDAQITKTRAEMNLKINDLKDQKQRLLAITHDGERSE